MFAKLFGGGPILKAELARAIREKAAAIEERDREAGRAADLAEELEEAWRLIGKREAEAGKALRAAGLAAGRTRRRLLSAIRSAERYRLDAPPSVPPEYA